MISLGLKINKTNNIIKKILFFEKRLKSKLPHIGINIFTKMSLLSAQYNAINLSQGYPDFEVDPELISLSKKYFDLGYNQYAPMQGVLK